MTKNTDDTTKPAPTPKPGEARTVSNIGVSRVETAEEVQQAKEGANQPVAPYPADPVEAHELAAKQAERAEATITSNDLPAVGMPPAEDEGKKKKSKAEELYPIRLLYDWWDGQGVRHPMDEVVDMPLNEAQKLMDEGKGEYAGKLVPKKG